jgi:hypothetical protein
MIGGATLIEKTSRQLPTKDLRFRLRSPLTILKNREPARFFNCQVTVPELDRIFLTACLPSQQGVFRSSMSEKSSL